MNLEIIAQQIKKCEKCRLCEKRTNAVPGEGSPTAKIVFIGEGPGRNEDLQGRPFVGAAGKFLTEMLESIGMKREDVFITNIVKCRPPNNRDPFDDEVEICAKLYLWNQLDLINPKLVATLGRHSMYRFLPRDLKISEVHGNLQTQKAEQSSHDGKPRKAINKITGKTFNILPLYHPAAALYNGSIRQTMLDDFKNIPKILERL